MEDADPSAACALEDGRRGLSWDFFISLMLSPSTEALCGLRAFIGALILFLEPCQGWTKGKGTTPRDGTQNNVSSQVLEKTTHTVLVGPWHSGSTFHRRAHLILQPTSGPFCHCPQAQ